MHDLTHRALVVSTFALLHAGCSLHAEQVTLAWDPNSEPNLVGYRLHYGTSAGEYDYTVDVGNVTTRTVTGLEPGVTYWFAATAYDSAGMESDFSNEVSYAVSSQGPTISLVSDQTIAEDTSTGLLGFTVGHPSSAADSLTVTASSSNTALVPQANLVLSGSGSSRTIAATPAVNASGSSTITLSVSDGSLTATTSFVLTVTAVNDRPTIGAIANRSINEDTVMGPVSFTVGDVDNSATALTVTATSGNTALVPQGNLVLGGSGSSRTITATPAANQSGSATITLAVSDGQLSANVSFVLTVNPVNDAPTISNIADQSTSMNTARGPIAFTVGDLETAAGSLTLTGGSSNPTLVPLSGIAFGGSAANRTVTVTPAANQTGTATITVTVSDGVLAASDTFVLNVTAVNTAPTVSDIPNQTINEDSATAALAFTVGDAETATGSLTVTASSSNTSLVPNGSILLGGSGASRTVTVTPAANQNGTATITVTASDGELSTSDTFVLTVNAVNDSPTVANIPDQSTGMDTVLGPVGFVVGDLETAAGSLTLTGASSNTGLVPTSGIVFGGSGANRTVTVTPAAGQTGTATLTVTVSDGGRTASDAFVLTVTPRANGLVAAYGFNEGTGTLVTDASGTGNNGTINAGTWTTGGRFGSALSFNGSSSRVTVNHSPSLALTTGMTLEAWVYPTAGGGWRDVIYKGVNDIYYLMGSSPAGPPAVGGTFASGEVFGTASLLLNTWTHLAGTYDGSTLRLYVNGVQVGSRAVTTPIAFSTGSLTIGSDPLYGLYFAGRIDEVRIYNRALNATEIQNDMNTPVGATPNAVPTISAIPNQTISEDGATSALAFTVGDPETAAGSLTVTGESSNPALVPNANLVFGGSGADRTVTVTPAANASGSTTITLRVSDGVLTATTSFELAVSAVNDRPTIGTIANRTISEDTVMGPVSFTVGDVDNTAGSLTVTASSSNLALVPQASLVMGGSGSSRTVTASPVANASGSTTITLQVSDGLLTASRSFVLTVTPVNDPPVITTVPDQVTLQDTPVGPIPFTVGDVETSAGSLTVQGASDNLSLVPGTGITLGGSGADRTVTLTPGAGQTGTATITLTVSDGLASASVQFRLTVDGTTLPPPWTSQDVGGPGLAGSASLQGGTFTILGGGANIGSVADQFHYVWQTLSGDGEIQARVPAVEPTSSVAKAGVMIRETLNANSRHMLMCVSPDRGFQVLARVSTSGNTSLSQGGALNPGADNWVRIVRRGSALRVYKSANGVSWTQVGSTIRMYLASQIHIGLAVTAGDNQQRCAATFDQVSVVP